MIVTDEKLLDEFRTEGECEICGTWAPKREPHHAIAKSLGGGSRMDLRENIVATSGHDTFRCQCHRFVHQGMIPKRCIFTVIALRENRTVDQIERFLYAVRGAKKGSDLGELRRKLLGEPVESA